MYAIGNVLILDLSFKAQQSDTPPSLDYTNVKRLLQDKFVERLINNQPARHSRA